MPFICVLVSTMPRRKAFSNDLREAIIAAIWEGLYSHLETIWSTSFYSEEEYSHI